MIVIGGGAIGCEMGQALSRLGSKVTILNSDTCLLPKGDPEAGKLLCEEFMKEGISVVNNCKIQNISGANGVVTVTLGDNQKVEGEKLLVAAGRSIAVEELNLDKAQVRYDRKAGIWVDEFLRTTQKHIYAVGDCNGHRLFTHAAMHQGMLALINSISPGLMKRRYKNYLVPWSVFTEPEVSQVGETEKELLAKGISYEIVRSNYADYERTTADGSEVGFIKALVSKWGRIYGVTVVGESSSEMINEFGFAIQEKRRLTSILFLQHSFPTFSFMNKRIAENWLMKKAQGKLVRFLAKRAFNLC